jgi:hypothetical protein
MMPKNTKALEDAARYVGDIGRLGPAMQALPSDNWRLFVYHLVTGPQEKGKLVRALLLAGFGHDSDAPTRAKLAWKIAHDDRTISAVSEETKKFIRVAAPEAAHAILDIIRNPDHPQRARAADAVLARVDPVQTLHRVDVAQTVEHRVSATPDVLARIEALAQRFGLDTRAMPALLDAPVIEGEVVK